MSNLPRITLDQDEPHNGDTVTFTVSRQARRSDAWTIELVLGTAAAVNHFPPDLPGTLQDVQGSIDHEFLLEAGDCTAVAWLLRNNIPQVGTLFWVQP